MQMQVTELKPEWLIELAPHYYQHKDVEDGMNLFLYFSVQLYCTLSSVELDLLNSKDKNPS